MGCVCSSMRDSAFYEAAKNGRTDAINVLKTRKNFTNNSIRGLRVETRSNDQEHGYKNVDA